jgi:uncharacterized protein (UPF0248 family)
MPLWSFFVIPIHKLISRIIWDKEFGRGRFELGYYDRIEKKIIRVDFSDVIVEPGNQNSVRIMDLDGVIRSIPLHRIKDVYRDKELIWHRDH